MLKLKDKQDVLMRYNKYGDSIRKITRDTGFSRNTVREYIREFEEDRKVLIEQDPTVMQSVKGQASNMSQAAIHNPEM